MTLGQKLKKLRTDNNLTQKDLADHLHVTFQTVSKWENDTNEPDFSTLKELAKILNCSIEYLFSDDEEQTQNEETPIINPIIVVPEEPILPVINPEPQEPVINTELISPGNQEPEIQPIEQHQEARIIGTCTDCGRSIYEGEQVHNIERRTPSGMKEITTICQECFQNREDAMNRRIEELRGDSNNSDTTNNSRGGFLHRIVSRNDRKPLIWAIILGILTFAAALVLCIIYYQNIGLLWTILIPIIGGYTLMATIYCIFTESYISDVFMEVASWSISFPGIIFSFDLDGLIFLIVMKALFAIIGFLIGLTVFVLAVAISAALSIFTFIPLIIYNRTHYQN